MYTNLYCSCVREWKEGEGETERREMDGENGGEGLKLIISSY